MASRRDPVHNRLVQWLMGRGESRPDAEDLLHDALIRVTEYARDHDVAHPEAFLRTTARHLLIDARRARAARGEHVLLDEEALASAAPSIEHTLMRRELVIRMADFLMRLDDETCEIVIDSRLFGMTHAEIAEARGLSVSTVERRIAKAIFLIAEWRSEGEP